MAEQLVKGTIEKWTIYGDKDNDVHIAGVMNNVRINTSKILNINMRTRIVTTKNSSYRLGTPFDSYALANYRLARDKKTYNEPDNKQ